MISERKGRGRYEGGEENLLISRDPLHIPRWRGDAPSRATYESEGRKQGYGSSRNGEQISSGRSELEGTNSAGLGGGGDEGGSGGPRGHGSEDSVCDAPAYNGLGAPTSHQLSWWPQIRIVMLGSLILTNSQRQLAPR